MSIQGQMASALPNLIEHNFEGQSFIISQSGELFIIDKVLSEIKEPLYKLKDLMHDSVPGFYYKEELTKARQPEKSDYFLVEDVLKEKVVKGKIFFLLK